MICFVDGTITALLPHGFRIAMTSGGSQDVFTLTTGTRLALAVGDRVRILGGPYPDGRGFAASTITRIQADGSTEIVPDLPRPGIVARLLGMLRRSRHELRRR
ncbi:MAG: hypothetical protein ABJD11_13200 [Gemmatimonadota bacterium]